MEEPLSVPKCIGIIMDGNRRYAQEHSLPQMIGHKRGLAKMKDVIEWIFDAGIHTAILYTFSTENWGRSKKEVRYLMKLFANALESELDAVRARGVRICFIGDLVSFPEVIRVRAERLEEETKNGKNGTLALAMSYGARTEITIAAERLVRAGVHEISEESFRTALPSSGLPDPDLIIRTGGERRLSNFLLYQAAYSELAFTDTKWPIFSHTEFKEILRDFAQRERRHGR